MSFYKSLLVRAKEIQEKAKVFMDGVLERGAYISQNPNSGFDPAQLAALFNEKSGETDVTPGSPEKRDRSPEKTARAEHTSPKKRGRDGSD